MSAWPNWEENKPMSLALILVSVFLVLFLWSKTDQTVKQTARIGKPDPFEHTFSVDGQAKVSGAPTIATITFSVETKGDTAAAAQTKNSEITNGLLAKVKALAIDDKDIQTANYNSYPNVVYIPSKQTTENQGWIVSQQISIKVRDTALVSKVLETVGQNGATNISGPNFAMDDQEALKSQARVKALEEAGKKAVELQRALGVRFERVIGYAEYTDSPNGPIMYADKAVGMGGGSAPDIAPGSVELTLHVTVTYKIVE